MIFFHDVNMELKHLMGKSGSHLRVSDAISKDNNPGRKSVVHIPVVDEGIGKSNFQRIDQFLALLLNVGSRVITEKEIVN